MSPEPDPPPPRYTRYRTRPRLFGEAAGERGADDPREAGAPKRGGGWRGRRRRDRAPLMPGRGRARRVADWWRHMTVKRALLGLLGLIVAWLLLSLVLFLISSHFERTSPPADVAAVLDSAGYPLTSVNNILVLGSDRRPKGSKEPGANTSGPSRSDSILLLRIGGGHDARLSIPRDTVIPIAGHGEQKINAAYAARRCRSPSSSSTSASPSTISSRSTSKTSRS
jgi:hypothetical protein